MGTIARQLHVHRDTVRRVLAQAGEPAPASPLRPSRRRLRHYAAPDLLLIDEVGYLSYSNRHADLLFELVSRRYQHKSTVVTTNVSLVDRLMHRAEVIRIEGESYRAKEAQERLAARAKQRSGKAAVTAGKAKR